MLAAYADHPNVAGLTVFSLGCEKAQIGLFQEALRERNLGFDKPCILLRQQDWSSEVKMMEEAGPQNAGAFQERRSGGAPPRAALETQLGVSAAARTAFPASANPAIGESRIAW